MTKCYTIPSLFGVIWTWLQATCVQNFLSVPSLLNNCLPAFLLSTQQTTQGRQHLQIEHSQDTPKQVQDK